ncbi:MAG: ABC transporter permease [Ruminococcaceae bacterium]|nr:ABC transporter permease [Oscillospiraceae bacterium]
MMRAHDMQYLVKEGFRNAWHNRSMALASVGVLICCLMLTGFSYLLFVNVDHVSQVALEQNVVAVFLDADLPEEDVDRVGRLLYGMDELADVSFVSKAEMLERYSKDLPPETFESLKEENPMIDTYFVSLKNLDTFEDTMKKLEALDGVEEVNYDGDFTASLNKTRRIVLGIGGVIVAVLLLVSLFIIVNTIKLTVYSRRLEIYIMKSVGATDGFVRLPFIVEGILLGLIAGGVSYGLTTLLYSQFIAGLDLGLFQSTVPYSDVWVVLLIGFLTGGVLVGTCGSVISISKYLKHEGGIHQ